MPLVKPLAKLLMGIVLAFSTGCMYILADDKPAGTNVCENLVVYHSPEQFCGWPANEGLWQWGNELLVGFEVASYDKNDSGHSIDRQSPKAIYFARSIDGGQSWQVEKPAEIAPPAYLEDPDRYKTGEFASKKLAGAINFAHPDFAMKLRAQRFYVSYNRGGQWQGPYDLPDFGSKLIMCRTDYIVLDKHDCLIFSTASDYGGNYGRSFAARTRDGGLSWEIEGWMTAEDFPPVEFERFAFSIMPSTIRLDQNTLLTALRQRVEKRKWLELYRSGDLGKTWKSVSEIVDNVNNPPSLLHLEDGRLVMVYCFRGEKPGLRAKLSSDNGETWSEEYVLRDDAKSWDIGYVRSAQLPDGKIVSIYYYHTEQMPEQHIAATIWQP